LGRAAGLPGRQLQGGKITVLVIDEAQTISAENMETLTHISNEQTQKHKLIQVVLLAQP
jgi:general secretion pathway protein A